MEDGPAPAPAPAPGGCSAPAPFVPSEGSAFSGPPPELALPPPPPTAPLSAAAALGHLDAEETSTLAEGSAIEQEMLKEMETKTPFGQAAEMVLMAGLATDKAIELFLEKTPFKALLTVPRRTIVNPPREDTSGRPLRSFEVTFRVILVPRPTGDKDQDDDARFDAAVTAALAETDPSRVVGTTYRWPQDVGTAAGAETSKRLHTAS